MTAGQADDEGDLEELGAVAQQMDELSAGQRARLSWRTVRRVGVLAVSYLLVLGVVLVGVVAPATPDGVGRLLPVVVVLSFVFETVDSASGMGFGTTLTPLLFTMGYDPLQVVPSLLVSETMTGLLAAGVHHEFGNVRFSTSRPLNRATRVTLVLTVTGLVGTLLSIGLAYVAFELPAGLLELYVAVLVIGMGVLGLVRSYLPRTSTYRSDLLLWFALLAGINKGVASGGYGPVVTLGQIFAGVYEKTATAISSLSEGIVSLVGALAYVSLLSAGLPVDYVLLPSLLAGAFFASIVAPYAVRVLPRWVLAYMIPLYAILIGVVVLAGIAVS